MSARADRKARTRSAILQAARDRFVAMGFEGATIRDVAEVAGVGVGTVHAHFGDKSGLLRACFDEQIATAVGQGLHTLDREAPLLEGLSHLARGLFDAYDRHPGLSREMLTSALFPARPDPHLEPLLGQLAGLFRAARDRGELLRLPAEGRIAAQGWFATYFTCLVGGLAGGFGEPGSPTARAARMRAFRQLMAVQLLGLGGRPSPFASLEAP